MQTTKSIVARTAALFTLAAVTGCASTSPVNTPDRSPSWTKQTVAGSRIARRLDSFGQPNTGTLVQVITDENLKNMPGTTLGDKLNGTPGGI